MRTPRPKARQIGPGRKWLKPSATTAARPAGLRMGAGAEATGVPTEVPGHPAMPAPTAHRVVADQEMAIVLNGGLPTAPAVPAPMLPTHVADMDATIIITRTTIVGTTGQDPNPPGPQALVPTVHPLVRGLPSAAATIGMPTVRTGTIAMGIIDTAINTPDIEAITVMTRTSPATAATIGTGITGMANATPTIDTVMVTAHASPTGAITDTAIIPTGITTTPTTDTTVPDTTGLEITVLDTMIMATITSPAGAIIIITGQATATLGATIAATAATIDR